MLSLDDNLTRASTVQVPTTVSVPFWYDFLHNPATLLAGIGAFAKWVLFPAAANHTRKELAKELEQVESHETRIKNLETIGERLTGVPEAVARIEERLKILTER